MGWQSLMKYTTFVKQKKCGGMLQVPKVVLGRTLNIYIYICIDILYIYIYNKCIYIYKHIIYIYINKHMVANEAKRWNN